MLYYTTPSLVATPQQGRAATKQTTLDTGLPEHAERARHLARAMSDTPGVVTLPLSSNPAAAAADGSQPAGNVAPPADSTAPAHPAPKRMVILRLVVEVFVVRE